MTFTINLAPDVAALLERQAAQSGQGVPALLENLVSREASTFTTGDYDPTALLETLHAFSDTDEYGDETEQRETLETLREALNSDRPGQRRLFGEGINPMPTQGDSA